MTLLSQNDKLLSSAVNGGSHRDNVNAKCVFRKSQLISPQAEQHLAPPVITEGMVRYASHFLPRVEPCDVTTIQVHVFPFI